MGKAQKSKASNMAYEKTEAQRKADGRTEAAKPAEKIGVKPLRWVPPSTGDTVCAD